MTTEVADREGYGAMGHPIPERRKTNAYHWLKSELGFSTEEAQTLVDRVAEQLERDEPYKAMREAHGEAPGMDPSSATEEHTPQDHRKVDVTGGYRLLAYLLTG